MLKRFLFLCSLACATPLTLAAASIDCVTADAQLQITTYSSPCYFNANSTYDVVTVSATPDGNNSIWTFKATDTDGAYYLYNEETGLYVGKTSTSSDSQALSLVSDVANAGRYQVAAAGTDGSAVSFCDIDNTTGTAPYLNAASTEGRSVVNYMLMNGTSWRPNSMFNLTPYTAETATVSDDSDDSGDSSTTTTTGELPDCIQEDGLIYICPSGWTEGYIYADVVNRLLKATQTSSGKCIWQLKSTGEDGVYYLYNPNYEYYFGKTITTRNAYQVSLVSDVASAGRYRFEVVPDQDNGYVYIIDVDNSNDDYKYLYSFHTSDSVVGNYQLDGQYSISDDVNICWFTVSAADESQVIVPELPDCIQADARIFISPSGWTNGYIYADTANSDIMVSQYALSTLSIWQLKATDEDEVYYIYNAATDLYIGKTLTTRNAYQVSLVSDVASAGRYKFKAVPDQTNGYIYIIDVDNPTDAYKYLYAFHSENTLVGNYNINTNYSDGVDICWFTARSVDEEEQLIPTELPDCVYDGSEVYISQYAWTGYTKTTADDSNVYSTAYRSIYAVWTLKAVEGADNVYYLYNKYTNKYLGKTSSTSSTALTMVDDIADAGQYLISIAVIQRSSATNVYIQDIENTTSNGYLATNATENASLVNNVSTNSAANLVLRSVSTEKYPGEPGLPSWIADGVRIYFTPAAREDGYINANVTSKTLYSSATSDSWQSVWKLIAVEGETDTYYFYNEYNGLYIGKTSTTGRGVNISLTSDLESAGRYLIESAANGDGCITCTDIDNPTASYASMNIKAQTYTGGNDTMVNWEKMASSTTWSTNSLLMIRQVSDSENPVQSYIDFIIKQSYGDPDADDDPALEAGAAYVGDYILANLQPYIDALQADPSIENFQALQAQAALKENMVQPIPGHYYVMESAFPYYDDCLICETYYDVHYHVPQGRQHIYCHIYLWGEDPVSAFWQYEEMDGSEATDGENNYYMMRAANSGLVMRTCKWDTVEDVRPDTDAEAGIFSFVKNSGVVYDHSCMVKSHYRNFTLPNSYWVGIKQQDDDHGYAFSLRQGEINEQSDDAVPGAANWRIREVTQVPVYFYHTTPIYYNADGTEVSDETDTDDADTESVSAASWGKSYHTLSESEDAEEHTHYNAYHFPFAVQVPPELTAYSGGYGLLRDEDDVNSNTLIGLTRFELPDGRMDIVPANTPFILEATSEINEETGEAWRLTVLPDVNYATINFGLEGGNCPRPLDSGEEVYVIHDDRDNSAHKVVEGEVYGYDPTEINSNTGQATYAIHNNSSTYVIPVNTAVVKVQSKGIDPDDTYIEDTGRPTTGVEDILVDNNNVAPATDEYGDVIYYDLTGRRVANPTAGLYILSTGKKVIIR